MASLFRLLFDTMPLACAEGAVHKQTGLPLEKQSIRSLREYMRFAADATTRHVENPAVPDAIKVLAKQSDSLRCRVPIWGFEAKADVNSVQNVTCRVQSDDFKKYVVLDNLSFARKVDGVLENSVEVQFGSQRFNLTLSEQSRLATFMTMDGYNAPNRHRLWPLEAWEDCGLLHVHVFDIELITKNITYLADLPDGHRDKVEVQRFLDRCKLFQDVPSDQTAESALFQDDLWRQMGADIAGLTVFDPTAISGVLNDLAALRVSTARVMVCCSVTMNRALDDYVSQRATWMGRLYPNIMVLSTLPMTKMKAGVLFERPSVMTIEDELPCGCGEMNAGIETLLVSDNNTGNTGEYIESLTSPTWDRIFNYYLPSAFSALRGVRVRVAKRVKHVPSNETWIDGAVIRRGDFTANRVRRVAGQGAFDNVHMAPSMKLPTITNATTIQSEVDPPPLWAQRVLDASDRSSWHFDDVRMAPFCAHDCFHMHWRWLNAWSDQYLAGWDGYAPNSQPGAPMVPENQEVFVEVLGPATLLYEAEAGLSPAGNPMDPQRWQVVCHHGAAYALDVTWKASLAQMAGRAGHFGTWTNFYPYNANSGWASFYWNLRYFVGKGASAPTERVLIVDLQKLLDA